MSDRPLAPDTSLAHAVDVLMAGRADDALAGQAADLERSGDDDHGQPGYVEGGNVWVATDLVAAADEDGGGGDAYWDGGNVWAAADHLTGGELVG